MQFIDLKAQQARIREDVEARLKVVLDHGRYVMGPEIDEIEESLANFSGAKFGLGCASGTDALLLALLAKGIGPGDAILTTPFTFIATAEVVSLLNAVPVFVDIDPKTFNMDPEALEKTILAMESGAGDLPLPKTDSLPKPKGIIAVDLFGQVADYARIEAVAEKHGLFVVEDAAQSFGALQNGKRACSFGHIACTSFFPAKPLGCYGDGGMCFTDDEELDKIMRSLRMHGQGDDRYDNVRIGINGRIDSFQAAVLISKFSIFPEELDLRQKAAERYNSLLAGSDKVVTPFVEEGNQSAWAQYTLKAAKPEWRDPLLKHLQEQGVPTAVYYPKPLHRQDAFADLGHARGDFPVSDDCAARVFSLPMHPYINEEDQEAVAKAILSFEPK
ncbi:dTDP-4-amino-4,6-dideoxygalactose transaminase [Desulfatibacillum alkenivorans DSM 16219]|jgi:dTDP-4-amino-4,6-dideoxygalactose transaminase|uniref:dTDP-4-amino-4,6-dideoxygalactose transaminase n=1 Tax=Desulfatibacillum alkenivorans DSM 16219 TaxID=1121393 RepID=A0A1M6BNL1_9BACT|nr:DegT/DnrJ/EryC1/StrS family aminotransferase [Desulfatibacillum alkenivorans]SHI50319.1 dTDP-4-amino-4,6-dideoxygalactose transaminase [Desulfatibacillum alkenivorans DSM 16219]